MRPTARSYLLLCLIPMLALFTGTAQASAETLLAQAINDYRAQPVRCANSVPRALSPLALKSKLALPVGFGGDLRETLKASGYRAVSVRTIRLGGASDANAAFDMLQRRYCAALLDTDFADIGITRSANEWRVVLAKPLLDGRLEDKQTAGKTLLAQVNAARAQPRMCGRKPYAAVRPLAWNAALETAAQKHSLAMANESYFDHIDPNGDLPEDRARAAGYTGRQVGENIASGQGSATTAMQGWLASPGHCANLMNPMFTQVGAAYATNSRSHAGVYWTMVFGAP